MDGYYIVGIDPSITNTGIVILDPEGTPLATHTIISNKKLPGFVRVANLAEEVMEYVLSSLQEQKAMQVFGCIEGPSYGSRTSALFELGELAGILQFAFTKRGYPFFLPSPMEVKKVYTGNGAAKKEDMRECAKLHFPLEVLDVMTEHEVDAHALAQFAFDFLEYLDVGTTENEPLENIATRVAIQEKWLERSKKYKGKKVAVKGNLDTYMLSKIKELKGE